MMNVIEIEITIMHEIEIENRPRPQKAALKLNLISKLILRSIGQHYLNNDAVQHLLI